MSKMAFSASLLHLENIGKVVMQSSSVNADRNMGNTTFLNASFNPEAYPLSFFISPTLTQIIMARTSMESGLIRLIGPFNSKDN